MSNFSKQAKLKNSPAAGCLKVWVYLVYNQCTNNFLFDPTDSYLFLLLFKGISHLYSSLTDALNLAIASRTSQMESGVSGWSLLTQKQRFDFYFIFHWLFILIGSFLHPKRSFWHIHWVVRSQVLKFGKINVLHSYYIYIYIATDSCWHVARHQM